MALKALMMRKKIDLKKKERERIRAQLEDLEKREAELVISVEEVTNEEEQQAVQESVDALIEEKEKLEASASELDKIINDLEAELEETEAQQDTTPPAEAAPAGDERSKKPMNISTRSKFFSRMNTQERAALRQSGTRPEIPGRSAHSHQGKARHHQRGPAGAPGDAAAAP